MHTVAAPQDLSAYRLAEAPAVQFKRRPGLLRRLLKSIQTSRQRRAERELALHFGLTGGRLTDETERRISEYVIRNGRL